MSLPSLQNLAPKDLGDYPSAVRTNTFCVYFKSPPGAKTIPQITVTPFMLKRGLNKRQDERREVAIVEATGGLRLEMSFELPHRLDEDTVQSVLISQEGASRRLQGRLIFASSGIRGPEEFIVQAYNERTKEWQDNFIKPGEETMVLTITYGVVEDRWRTRPPAASPT